VLKEDASGNWRVAAGTGGAITASETTDLEKYSLTPGDVANFAPAHPLGLNIRGFRPMAARIAPVVTIVDPSEPLRIK
jgi:hypothetical protein